LRKMDYNYQRHLHPHSQSLSSILWWIIEIEGMCIECDGSIMVLFMEITRRGDLETLYQIFAFLRDNNNSELVLDPLEIEIDMKLFPKEDWSNNSMYGKNETNIPVDSPQPFGKTIKLIVDVNVDVDVDAYQQCYRHLNGNWYKLQMIRITC